MTIDGQERDFINRWSGEQRHRVMLDLTLTEHPASEPLRDFCRHLARSCDLVQLNETAEPGTAMPALRLRQGAIVFRAVPRGTELEPFFAALSSKSAMDPATFRPASLLLFVAAACPHCPVALRSLLPLITPGGPLTLEVIDSEVHSDPAEAHGIKSVPTVLLDRTFRWTGTFRPDDVAALLSPEPPSAMDAGLLERLLEAGNAGPLAGLMLESGTADQALCQLLAAEAISVRIGAMMVVEELLERKPDLVQQLIPGLESRFTAAPDPARGDMLYIFGEAGLASMATRIKAMLESGLHPEVEEAAHEALERLAERHQ